MSEKMNRGLKIELTFIGERSELERALLGMGRTHTSDVMIGTWPTPEKSNPGRDVNIQLTFPSGSRSKLEETLVTLGKTKLCRVMIETVPLPE